MELTKNDTNISKGLAICLMFVHHLFYSAQDRMVNGNFYIPMFMKFNIEHYLSDFSKICVAIFIFLSGYGLYKSSSNNNTIYLYLLNKLVKFYTVYWTYFIIFIPIGFIFYSKTLLFTSAQLRYSYDIIQFVENFLGFSSSYNPEWWFVELYVSLIAIVYPLYLYLIKNNIAALILLSALFYSLSDRLDILNGILYWQASFLVGMFFAKYGSRFTVFFNEVAKLNICYLFMGLVTCFLLRFRLGMSFDFLLAPFFIVLSVGFIKYVNIGNYVAYIGKYSFPMWLNHSFFCYYYFQDIVFFPRYSPLVFITLLCLSLSVAVVVENARSWFTLRLRNYKKAPEIS